MEQLKFIEAIGAEIRVRHYSYQTESSIFNSTFNSTINGYDSG